MTLASVPDCLLRSPRLNASIAKQNSELERVVEHLPGEFSFVKGPRAAWTDLKRQEVDQTKCGLYVVFIDQYVLYVGKYSEKGRRRMSYTITERHARTAESGVFRNPFRVMLWFDVVQFLHEAHRTQAEAARAVLEFLKNTKWCWGYFDAAGLGDKERELQRLLSPLLNEYPERPA